MDPGPGKRSFWFAARLWLLEEADIAPEELLLLSFSRRWRCGPQGAHRRGLSRSHTVVPASTFHSLAARLLESHAEQVLGWTGMPALLTGPEQVALVHDMLSTEDLASWPLPFRNLLTTNSFAREVTDFLLRCQEQLINGSQLPTWPMTVQTGKGCRNSSSDMNRPCWNATASTMGRCSGERLTSSSGRKSPWQSVPSTATCS